MTDQLLLIIGITTLCMFSPGPDMALVMRNTLVGGRSSGSRTALGVLTGNLFHIGYCALGIGWIVSRSVLGFTLLKFGCAAYLIYLGYRGLRDAGTKMEKAVGNGGPCIQNAYRQGLINNLLNPKGSLFYLGVFSQVITPETTNADTLLIVLTMMGVSSLFWVVFIWTLHLPTIRAAFDNTRTAIERTFGALLILLGIRVATFD